MIKLKTQHSQLKTTSMLQTINTHGLTLAALPLGNQREGEPLVLLHGVTHSVYFWQPDPLYTEFGPCWSLSLPGHFPACTPAEKLWPFTAESVIDPLADAIKQLCGDQPVNLIGVSTGGFAALGLAARYPTLVRRVISISGFARGRWIGSFGMLQGLARGGSLGQSLFRATSDIAGGNPLAVRMVLATAGPNWQMKPLLRYPYLDAVLKAMQPAINQADVEALFAYFSAMPEIDISAWLGAIRAPTLLIAGGRDPIVATDQSRQIANLVPGAQLHIFPEAGHLPNFEHYKEYCALVRAWLSED
jgi:pimeloyl-ACP methyl ester carboxylesterase